MPKLQREQDKENSSDPDSDFSKPIEPALALSPASAVAVAVALAPAGAGAGAGATSGATATATTSTSTPEAESKSRSKNTARNFKKILFCFFYLLWGFMLWKSTLAIAADEGTKKIVDLFILLGSGWLVFCSTVLLFSSPDMKLAKYLKGIKEGNNWVIEASIFTAALLLHLAA